MWKTFLFQVIQFSQAVLIQLIQFSVSTVSMYPPKKKTTVPFQIIQFSISMQFKCKYGLIVKSISISSYSVWSNNSVSISVVRAFPISLKWTLLTVISTERFRCREGKSILVLSEQHETSYLFYVTLSFLCNIIKQF